MAGPIAMALILGAIALFVVLSSAADRRQGLRSLAESVRGRVLEGAEPPIDLQEGIVVPFRLGGRGARLLLAPGSSTVEVGVSGLAGGDLHVFPDGWHGGFNVGGDLEIGDPVFDRAWVVQGDLAKRVFAPESRAQSVAAIHALRTYVDPCVEVRRGALRVRVLQPPESELTVRILVKAAEAVLDAGGPRVAEGVLWIEVRDDAAPVCQVCGTEAAIALVVCRACRTPHHEDCWRYTGRCSTYGCGSRQLARRRV